MEQLCRKINMPEEVTRKMVELHASLEEYPCLSLLMEESTWAEGLEQIKQRWAKTPKALSVCAVCSAAP